MMQPITRPPAAETRMVHPVFPGDTNHHHTLFGGTAMAWMDEAAFICATRWCRMPVVTVHSGAMSFHHPVPEGTIVEVIARVVRTGRTSITVLVELWVEPMDRDERLLASQAEIVLVAMDGAKRPQPVPPLVDEQQLNVFEHAAS